VDDGSDRAGNGRGIDDQKHRGVEEAGDVGGGGRRVVGGAVEQAHDPFDDEQVGALGGAGGEWADGVGAAQPGVEVAGRSTAGEGVVAGVDEIGADLGGGGAVPGGPEGSEEAGGGGGLADAGVGARDDDSGSERRHEIDASGAPEAEWRAPRSRIREVGASPTRSHHCDRGASLAVCHWAFGPGKAEGSGDPEAR
jgi:hypothetical protein